MEQNEQYVYQYRDKKNGKVLYVGRGKSPSRAVSHQKASHNVELESWLEKGQFKLEIAGPFGNQEVAKAVESALISSLTPKFNGRQESSRYTFRPLGVPEQFVSRLEKEPLGFDDLFKGNTKKILLVRVTDQNFQDRVGYDLVSPPTDEDVVERVRKYWQLGGEQYLENWMSDPDNSPTLLLGVTGAPGSQIIIASLAIDVAAWNKVEIHKGNLIDIPLKEPSKLDKHYLRGYRIKESAEIAFGRYRQDFFNIIEK